MLRVCILLICVLATMSLQYPKVIKTKKSERKEILDIHLEQKQVIADDIMVVFVNATDECMHQIYRSRDAKNWTAVYISKRRTSALYQSLALPYRQAVVVMCHTLHLEMSFDQSPLFWLALQHNRDRIEFLLVVEF